MPTGTALVQPPIVLTWTTKVTFEQIAASHLRFLTSQQKTSTADRVIFPEHKCDFHPVIQNPLFVTHPLQEKNELEKDM